MATLVNVITEREDGNSAVLRTHVRDWLWALRDAK